MKHLDKLRTIRKSHLFRLGALLVVFVLGCSPPSFRLGDFEYRLAKSNYEPIGLSEEEIHLILLDIAKENQSSSWQMSNGNGCPHNQIIPTRETAKVLSQILLQSKQARLKAFPEIRDEDYIFTSRDNYLVVWEWVKCEGQSGWAKLKVRGYYLSHSSGGIYFYPNLDEAFAGTINTPNMRVIKPGS